MSEEINKYNGDESINQSKLVVYKRITCSQYKITTSYRNSTYNYGKCYKDYNISDTTSSIVLNSTCLLE